MYATSYAIAYKDDDGEVTDITTDSDLTEAIHYFQAGSDDPPTSSATSILSGRSFGNRKITLRVHITVDYDGPSLSDTSSLASMDEYKGRHGSQLSLSFSTPPSVDIDDDSITVSSRDAGGPPRGIAQHSGISERLTMPPECYISAWDSQTSSSLAPSVDSRTADGPTQSSSGAAGSAVQREDPFTDNYGIMAASDYPEDPSAVFERLKLQEAVGHHPPHLDYDPSVSANRGAAWLRDQNARTIRSMLGALPEPSEPDSTSLSLEQGSRSDELSGDLALHRDPRGKYYYSYTSAGSASVTRSDGNFLDSQSQHSGYDDAPDVKYETEEGAVEGHETYTKPRPTSMQLTWLASQQKLFAEGDLASNSHPSLDQPFPPSSSSDPLPVIREYVGSEIPPEVLQFISLAAPPEDILTECSECGVVLDSIRYVCSACGEKTPRAKLRTETFGKGKDNNVWGDGVDGDEGLHLYPPPMHRSPLYSSCALSPPSNIAGSSSVSSTDRLHHKPLPSLPSLSSSTTLTVSDHRSPWTSVESGYELCSGCIESAGVNHALELSLAPGISTGRGNSSPSSPEDAQRALSQRRRSAPKQKGQLRHAYVEKVWAHRGWEDVGT